MKSPIALFLCLFQCYGLATFAQNRDTEGLVKEIKRIIKKESLVRNEIDWDRLDRDLAALPYSGNHVDDKELVFETFIKTLKDSGDPHSLFYTQQLSEQIQNVKTEVLLPLSEYLGNGIGYVKIPKTWSFDFSEDLTFTDTIISQIQKLDQFEIENWIIDLRGNQGGNGWPMLAGLIPIIGDGLVGYKIGPKKTRPQSIKKGTILYSELETKTYTTKISYRKIAVLLDERTASSGELVALSILGFENTKSFGQNSAGLTTYNTGFGFSNDASTLFLATSFMADKNRKVYKNGISPNVYFLSELSEKAKMNQVIEWLLSN